MRKILLSIAALFVVSSAHAGENSFLLEALKEGRQNVQDFQRAPHATSFRGRVSRDPEHSPKEVVVGRTQDVQEFRQDLTCKTPATSVFGRAGNKKCVGAQFKGIVEGKPYQFYVFAEATGDSPQPLADFLAELQRRQSAPSFVGLWIKYGPHPLGSELLPVPGHGYVIERAFFKGLDGTDQFNFLTVEDLKGSADVH